MATTRDESNNIERDELETQGGLEGDAPRAQTSTVIKNKTERGEIGGPRIEGLDESEDPTGGAGGP